MRAASAVKLGGDMPLDNLVVGDRPKPEPGPGEVRVRVMAASLNHHDLFTLRGIVGYPIVPPRILGCDASGVVDSYGPDRPAGSPDPGSDVVLYPVTQCGRCPACAGADAMLCRRFTMLSDGDLEGSFAEFVVMPARSAVPKPAGLSYAESTCLGVAYLTAYRMLFVKARLRPGQSALVQGAGGGLAIAAIQLASAAGVRVIASSRSAAKLEAVKKFGARDVVLAGRDAAKAVLGLTGGDGVDAVIDSVGEPNWATSLRAVKQGGAIVVAGATGGPNPPADLSRIFWRQISVLGSTMGTLSEFVRLLGFVELSGIRPPIDSTYPLSDIRTAFERLERGEQLGKIVITIPS